MKYSIEQKDHKKKSLYSPQIYYNSHSLYLLVPQIVELNICIDCSIKHDNLIICQLICTKRIKSYRVSSILLFYEILKAFMQILVCAYLYRNKK